MHETPHQAHGNQAYGSLLVLLCVVLLSLFGLLGVYASERNISTHQRDFGKGVGENAASRKTLLWKGAKQIPRLLHRMELNGSGVPIHAALGADLQKFLFMSPRCCMNWHGALHASRGILDVLCGPSGFWSAQ